MENKKERKKERKKVSKVKERKKESEESKRKKERNKERKDEGNKEWKKVPGPCIELKKTVEHESDVDTITEGLVKGQEYWEKSWRLEEICCHSNSSERQSANADIKNSNE